MDKFVLKTKQNEILNVTTQKNLEDAVELFSKIKNLNIIDLLKIYRVEKNESRDNN